MALQFEERDLVAAHGKTYEQYRKQTPMLLPVPKRSAVDRVDELRAES